MGKLQPCSRRSKHVEKQSLKSFLIHAKLKKTATPVIMTLGIAAAFLGADLFIPSIASAHILGPEFILFAMALASLSFVVLTFAIGLVKYAITAHFFGNRLDVSRKIAFIIIMVDSAIFAMALLGATPVDITSFFPVAKAALRFSEKLGILIFYLSLNYPVLFRNLFNTLLALPLLYPITMLINARLFSKTSQSVEKSRSLRGRWQLASVTALITPISICIAFLIAAAPMITKSQAAIDSLFEDAIADADVDMAASLLRQGANVDAKSREGGRVLQTAFAFGRMPRAGTPISIVKFILDNGADVNAVEDNTGMTVLMGTSDGYDRIEEFKLLLERQPDVHAVDKEGNNALHYALRRGQIDKAALLIARGVDIDRKNNRGNTVLTDAALQGNMEVVRFLLDNKADIRLKDSCGRTALRLAVLFDRKEVAELIYAHGGDPKDMDKNAEACSVPVPIPKNDAEPPIGAVQKVGGPPAARQ